MKHHRVFLIFIFGIAVFFRFFQITNTPPGLYIDEAMNGNNALEALRTGNFRVFYEDNNGREGLFILLEALSLIVFPTTEPWVLRIPSAVIGSLTVIGFYLFVQELSLFTRLPYAIQSTLALGASFFLATSFWHIVFSRIAFRAILAPFFFLWSFFFLFWVYRRFTTSRFSLPFFVFAGFLYGLGFYSYPAYISTFLVLILVFLFLFIRHRAHFFLPCTTFFAALFVTLFPLIVYSLTNPSLFFLRTRQLSLASAPDFWVRFFSHFSSTFSMLFFEGDANWRHGIAHAPLLTPSLAFLFITGFLFLLRYAFRFPSHRLFFLFSCVSLFSFSLPASLSNEGVPHALRSLLMTPIVSLFIGAGAVYSFIFLLSIFRFLPSILIHHSRILSYSFLFCAVFFFAFQTYTNYFTFWSTHPETARAFRSQDVAYARMINAATSSVPIYIILPPTDVSIRNLPSLAQPIMFLTDTFLPVKQMQRNIHYILPQQESTIPSNGIVLKLAY